MCRVDRFDGTASIKGEVNMKGFFWAAAAAALLATAEPRAATAGEGFAEVIQTQVVNVGGWRDGYGLFDYVVVYRWPKNSYWAAFAPTTGRAGAALLEMRGSNGIGRVWSDGKYYYIRVQAGFRARVINPLSYGYRPYAYQSEARAFANELKIRWRSR
jgi:hypothetical protein